MLPSWQADIAVSVELAKSLIESQFPTMAPATVTRFGAGWDNAAFLVNDAHVFRFPRRKFAAQFMDAETRVMPWLGPRLPLAVPVPRWIGQPTEEYPWPFAGYARIPGRTACSFALTASQRLALAGPLARFLAALHGIDIAEAARHEAGPDSIARLDLARRLPQTRTNLEQLAVQGIVKDARPYRAILDAAPTAYVPRKDTLVHGDLYARHLLLDSECHLAGVIDWGDVHLGDPAADLMIAHAFLPPTAREVFRQEYPPAAEITWQVARVRALWHTLILADYAHRIADADLAREAQASLDHLASA